MDPRHPRLATTVLATLCGLSLACGTGAGDARARCMTKCQEAQDRSCTSITRCDGFCQGGIAVAEKAGCQAQFDAYDACAGREDACDVAARCDAEQKAVLACTVPFCLGNPKDADCLAFATAGSSGS